MPATIQRERFEQQAPEQLPPTREVSIAVAHQKGGVGKSTSTVLLAAEIAWLRPDLRIAIEDRDPDRNLSSRWPGDTDVVQLVEPGAGAAHVRLIDTGPGNADQLAQVLRDAEYVVVPVRLEPMTVQALGLFLPRLRELQRVNHGMPRLAGLLLTHFVGRSADHAHMRAEIEAYARAERTRILGIVPFSTQIGMRLSTKGHYYRPAAQYLLEVIADGHGA